MTIKKETLETILASLTEHNVACTCCDSNEQYEAKVNEVGALIDGRKWHKRWNGERNEYVTEMPDGTVTK